MIDYSKIKLVIWDLDDTFWKGTLSEGPIVSIAENIQLVRDLTDRGIVNSICSKNDYKPTVQKLKELEVDDLFVFKSIDWTPKGQRISKLIKDMGLRPVNCLFFDDNIVNLNEASYYSTELMVAEPSEIMVLIEYCRNTPVSDSKHKRLNNYKVLEKKQEAKENSEDNIAFLWSTNTKVEIHKDCVEQIDRIVELVGRTNQLNFTKLRSTKEELLEQLNQCNVDAGYVTVRDNFGDYGIVGFYLIRNGKCVHFLFSCRTIGQGVEQYVYSTLRWPELEVVGPVVNQVERIPAPEWINQDKKESEVESGDKSHAKIVFKGACDLRILATFLKADNIIEEFTYVSLSRHNSIEHHNHSVNYLSFPFLSDSEKKILLDECIFNDEEMFETKMFDKDTALVFLSTQIEPNLGVYRRKSNGLLIAWGEYLFPLTDRNNWKDYIDGSIFGAGNHFTEEWLKEFSERYEFVGRLLPEQFIGQMDILLEKLQPNALVCLLLGSEIPYKSNTEKAYADRHIYYKEINEKLREYVKTHDRVRLLDFNDYLKSYRDFTDNINHYHRNIYYAASHKANEYIFEATGQKVKEMGKLFLMYEKIAALLGRNISRDSAIYKILRNLYFTLRGQR